MNIINETCVEIHKYADVVAACRTGQALAAQLGLSDDDQVNVVLTVLTTAREITRYGRYGEVTLSAFQQGDKRGILVNVDGAQTTIVG